MAPMAQMAARDIHNDSGITLPRENSDGLDDEWRTVQRADTYDPRRSAAILCDLNQKNHSSEMTKFTPNGHLQAY